MKKLSLLFIFVFAFFALTACFGETKISSIELLEQPKTVYTINETNIMPNFSIRIIYSSGTTLVVGQSNSLIEVEGFSTSTAGTFTAHIKYNSPEYNGAPISFQYTVVDPNEIQGSGTLADPYLISTPEQFNDMLMGESRFGRGKHYRLTNDIDFTGIAIKQYATDGYRTGTPVKNATFSAHIDGANFSLLNINEIEQSNALSKYKEIFGYVENFSLKNINIVYASNSDMGVTGLVTACVQDVLFENVNTSGYIKFPATKESASNISPFVALADRGPKAELSGTTVTFRNCKNYTDLLVGGKAQNIGGFIGSVASTRPSELIFINCINYGIMEGASSNAGGLFGTAMNSIITITNSKNEGNILNMNSTEQLGKYDESKTTIGTFEGNGNIVSLTQIEVDVTNKTFTTRENHVYLVQYRISTTYSSGIGTGTIGFTLGSEGSYEHPFVLYEMPIDKTFVGDPEVISEALNKYVDGEGNQYFIYNSESDIYTNFGTTVTISVFEYDTQGKLTGCKLDFATYSMNN